MPPDPDRIRTAASLLHEALDLREPFVPLPDDCAPRDIGEAYAVQASLQAMRAPALGPIVGWKIAGASRARAKMLGLDEPLRGGIHASLCHRGACTLRKSDYAHLGIECEIVLEIGVDVPPGAAPVDGAQAAAYVRAAMPGFEVVDDRYMQYPPPARMLLHNLAANAGNAGLVVGRGVTDWRGLALADLRAECRVRGRFAGESTARETVGDPLDSLAWLIRGLSARGIRIAAGTLVATGSLGPTRFLQSGEDAEAVIEGLGAVRVAVV